MWCTCTFVAFFSRGRNPFVIVVELFRVGWAGEQFNNIGIYFDVQISISLFNACKFCSYGHSRDLLNLIVQFIAKKTNKQATINIQNAKPTAVIQDSFQCSK